MTNLSPTDWRALCAELHAAFNTYAVNEKHHRLLVRTADTLAQPEPEWVTDEELLNLGNDLMGDCLPCDPDLLLAFARSVLARFSRPTI